MPATTRTKAPKPRPIVLPRSKTLPPSERRNPHSMPLDKLSAEAAVTLMLAEEARVAGVIRAHRKKIAAAVELVARAFRRGGRLFYVGAGTSGRLGVLDSSECPPTFGSPPEMVQAIIAGGETALRRAVEGAEDNVSAGAEAIRAAKVAARDVVLGIAASGTTPFVWGALREAKRRRAATLLLCCNPQLEIPAALRPKLVIALNTGPEVLTGSTRLKAGTATKIVLNIISTLAMVRIGKVLSNLMVDVIPSNKKLRARAVRITESLTGKNTAAVQAALERCNWNIKRAAALLGRK